MKNKLLLLIPLVALVGCKEYRHKNIVTGVMGDTRKKMLLLQDVETKKERVFYFSSRTVNYDLNFIMIDDTVDIIAGCSYRSNDFYEKHLVLYTGDFGIDYNNDSIFARHQREELNKAKLLMKENGGR